MLSEKERDAVIRTVYGEARGESEKGMTAVAHVIRNRVVDVRWPGNAESIVKAKAQFSAWNPKDVNFEKIQNLPTKSVVYKNIGHIVDAVWAGEYDPTNGAVYYYAPQGMKGGKAPKWWGEALAESDGKFIQIGNHFFAGRVKREREREAPAPVAVAVEKPLLTLPKKKLAKKK